MGDILFLAHRVPFPPNRGDKIRSAHLLKKLAQLAPVHVGCFAENAEDRSGVSQIAEMAKSHCVPNRLKPLPLAGVEAVLSGKPVSLTAFHCKRLQSWVEQTCKQHRIDTIVIFSGQMGQYIPEGFKGRVMVDLCDVDSAKFESYADAGERVWLNAREARLLIAEEERLAQRADATILISDNEAALFRSRLKQPARANVCVIGNGINAAFFDPGNAIAHPQLTAEHGPHFVFTGQMDYRPNEQACEWIAQHFMPAIRKRFANAQFHIVGRNPTAKVLALNPVPGVKVWGEVPDVRPFIAAADIVLAPLLIARGVQNKVLEAMAMEKPVLLTQEAATGIAATDGLHWMLETAEAEAMCKRAQNLINDRQAYAAMSKAARQFVVDQHCWDAMLAPLTELICQSQDTRNAA